MALYTAADVIAQLRDGRLIATGTNWVVTVFTNGCQAINVRVPDLKRVAYVIDIQFHMSPLDCTQPVYEGVNKRIVGNVVGMTVMGAAFETGTTLTVEVTAVGPP